MSQAVSDLSVNNAPSKMLWNRLASLYAPCGIVSIMMVCVGVRNKLNKTIRVGIPERFSVFAATGFNAVLGIYLFKNFMENNLKENIIIRLEEKEEQHQIENPRLSLHNINYATNTVSKQS